MEKNRTVSNQPRVYHQVQSLEIPESGLVTHLKEFGFVKLFRKVFKKEDYRLDIFYLTDSEKLKQVTRSELEKNHDLH